MKKFDCLTLIATLVVALAVPCAKAQGVLDLPLDELLSTKISTAAKYDQQMSEVAASVTIISSEEIQRYGWTSFDELMNAIRGVYLGNDRNYSSLGVRGISRFDNANFRALVLIDSNPVMLVFGVFPVGNSLSIALGTIDRVEFVRGPGSALYGTGAMFAVVNVITKKANELDGVSGDLLVGSKDRQQAVVQFGKTFGSGVSVASSVNWSESNGGDLHYPEFDSPETNGGVAKGLDFENFRAAMATLTYGPLKVWGRVQERQKGVPTGSFGRTFNQFAQTTDQSANLAADYTKGFGPDKQLDVRTYWMRDTHHGVYPYDEYHVIATEEANGARYGAEGRFRWDLKANQRLVIGSEVSRTPIADYTLRYGDYESGLARASSLASIYLQHEYQPFKRISLVTGVRYDKYSYSKGSTNPRLAVIFTPTAKTSLKLLYGSAFRVASVYELELESAGYAKKNPDLAPERVRSLEAVVEQRLTGDTFAVFSAYRLEASRLIEYRLDPADSQFQFQNTGAARGYGYELELNMRRKDGLWAYASYTHQNATEAGAWMTNSPHHLLKAGVSSNPWARIHGGLEVSYESARLTLQDTTTDPVMLVHGTASVRIARRTRLILSVRNLFNAEYANPVGPEFRQAAIARDGRTAALSISFAP